MKSVGPTKLSEENRHKAEELIQLGKECFSAGHYVKARDCFLEAYRLDGQNGVALNGYATALCELNQGEWTEEAIDALLKSLAVDPLNAKAWNNLGDYFYRRGEFEKSIEHFERAIHLHPSNASTYVNLAMAYRNLHRSEDAIRALCGALIIDPNHPWTRYQLGLTYLNRGMRFENPQDLEKAYEILRGLQESQLKPYGIDRESGLDLEKLTRMIGTFMQMHRNMSDLKEYLVETLHYYGDKHDQEVFACMVN